MKTNNNEPYNETNIIYTTLSFMYIPKPKSEISLPQLSIIRLYRFHNIPMHACTLDYKGSLNISIN